MVSASATSVKATVAAASTVPASTPDMPAIPAGVIVMWSGALAAIPVGWGLCDGTNGTPNLTDRFILPTATNADIGTTGGTAQHKHAFGTLANSSDSAGTPAGSIDGHTSQNLLVSAGAQPVLEGPATHTFTGSPLAAHTHTLSGKTANAEDGAGSTADVRPPWFKLAFIMKLAA